MPVIYIPAERSGKVEYEPSERPFDRFKERPEYFLGNEEEYQKRLAVARTIILESIRFSSNPLAGRGMAHEVVPGNIDSDIQVDARLESLVDLVNEADSLRANRVRLQRQYDQSLYRFGRRRSPQDVKRRRSALFSGSEICPSYFLREYGEYEESDQEREELVDVIRWRLIFAAAQQMMQRAELVRIGDSWYIPVSVMDAHDPAREQRHRKSQRSSKQTKHDDRSFHGRPNRDRGKIAA